MDDTNKDQEAIEDVMNLLEVEPTPPSGEDHREQLAVLVVSGKSKEMVGIDLNQDQVKSLTEKVVEKYFTRYDEASLSAKTCDAMVETFLQLSCQTLARFLSVDQERHLKEMNENFMVKRELTMTAGRLSLKYGRIMAIANAALLTAKNLTPCKEPVASTCKELDQELDKTLTGT